MPESSNRVFLLPFPTGRVFCDSLVDIAVGLEITQPILYRVAVLHGQSAKFDPICPSVVEH